MRVDFVWLVTDPSVRTRLMQGERVRGWPCILYPRFGRIPSILTPYSARSEAPYDPLIVHDPGTDNDSLYLASLWWVIRNPAGQYDPMILYSPGSLNVIVEVTWGTVE